VILLTVLGIVSYLTGDLRATIMIGVMVVLGIVLRFFQELRSDNAAEKLKAMVSTTTTVVPSGEAREIPFKELVPFVESLFTQTLIIHVIRTNKIPFLQSRASWPLTATTVVIMCFGMWLPFSPMAGALGFVRLPGLYWPLLALTLVCYMGLTQIIKAWLFRKAWI
jgi:magnesium-transporting ATPase (P-type)